MAPQSSILAWKIPWTEEPEGYSLWGARVDTTERLTFSLSILTITGQQRRDQDNTKSFFFLYLREIFKDFSIVEEYNESNLAVKGNSTCIF